jgi:hypothetical protein
MRDYDDDYDELYDDWQRPRYSWRTIIFSIILLIAMLIGVLYPVASLFFQGGERVPAPRPTDYAPLFEALAAYYWSL